MSTNEEKELVPSATEAPERNVPYHNLLEMKVLFFAFIFTLDCRLLPFGILEPCDGEPSMPSRRESFQLANRQGYD